MKYIDFLHHHGNNPLIDLKQYKLFNPGFSLQQLSLWTRKGYLIKISDRYWVIKKTGDDIKTLLANRLREPSYLSNERALGYYRIIPEHIVTYTSITPSKTKTMLTPLGAYQYQQIKPSLYRGYDMVEGIAIACCEKALCDYLYFHPDIRTLEDMIESVRWNMSILDDIINHDRLILYSRYYPSTIQTTISILLSSLSIHA